MARGGKVAQDQAISQHRLHQHSNPKMPADLLHNKREKTTKVGGENKE